MTAKITKQGLLIPLRLLRGVKRVEIQRKKSRITIFASDNPDPIHRLGRKPVSCGVADASTNHDKYLYEASA